MEGVLGMHHGRILNLLSTVLVLFLLPANALFAEEFMMVPAQQQVWGFAAAYRSHQVIDFNQDGFDDLAVLYRDRLVVYSIALDTVLWQLTGDDLAGFTIHEDASSGQMEAFVFTCSRNLYHYWYPDTSATDSIHQTGWPGMDMSCPRAQLVIRDLGSNGTFELIVSERIATSYLCRMTGWDVSCYDNFTFGLPDMAEQEFFDQYQYGHYASDSVSLEADLDGDGFKETVSFGRSLRGGCEYNDEGEMLGGYTVASWEITVYNQLGQRIGIEYDSRNVGATVGDFDPALAGDECLAKVTETEYSGGLFSTNEPHDLFCFKLNDGQFVTLWSGNAAEYRFDFLLHPAFPGMFCLEHQSGLAWHVFDGSNGSQVHTVYGLQPQLVTIGGLFTPAADTGLQIVQLAGDTITLYGTAVPTDVDDPIGSLLPTDMVLEPNYPNPFNPATAIRFHLPMAADVRLEIFNTAGQRVAKLIDQYLPAGAHSAMWDASGHASGVYMYRLTAGELSQSRKMVLLK
jgi:hypothetical protein